MVRVAPIRLAFNPRTLWFDPRDLDIHNGDDVVVLTVSGRGDKDIETYLNNKDMAGDYGKF